MAFTGGESQLTFCFLKGNCFPLDLLQLEQDEKKVPTGWRLAEAEQNPKSSVLGKITNVTLGKK